MGTTAFFAAAIANAHNNFQTFGGGPDCWVVGHEHKDVFYTQNGGDCAGTREDNDEIYLGANDDYGGGEGGNDVVDGADGADYVEGFFGEDELRGGAGPDKVDALHGDWSDAARGGAGDNDICYIDVYYDAAGGPYSKDFYEGAPSCNFVAY